MAPPFISEYKYGLVLKRLFETFLGGFKLYCPFKLGVFYLFPVLPLVLIACHIDWEIWWTALLVGSVTFVSDLILTVLILLLKRGRSFRVRDKSGKSDANAERGSESDHREGEASFLAEEDKIPNDGIFKASTWHYVAANVRCRPYHFLVVGLSSLAIGLTAPILVSEHTYIVFKVFGTFTLCNARYSSVINSPPEIATFGTPLSDERPVMYRTCYTLLIGLSHSLVALVAPDLLADPCLINTHAGILSAMTLFWGCGILPPISALLPWSIETMLLILGGTSPSWNYFGSFISLVTIPLCTIVIFVLTQDPIKIILAQCLCGYIIASDTGRLATISISSGLCEDIPTKSFLGHLLLPCLQMMVSLACVIFTWTLLPTDSNDYLHAFSLSFSSLTLTISLLSWTLQYFSLNKESVPGTVLIKLLYGTLPFLLHSWMTLSIQHEAIEWSSLSILKNETNTQSLIKLVPYLLSIRGFASGVLEPRKASLDFSFTLLTRQYLEESKTSFVLILFICSLLTGRVKRLFRLVKTFCSVWYAFLISTILEERKTRVLALAAVLLPISILSLSAAVLVEGMILIPVFTLPIFILGFPRPSSFWREKWIGKVMTKPKESGKASDSLDRKVYAELGSGLASALARKADATKFALERGDCYLARYEDRTVFISVIARGWKFLYLQVKGLEMQEPTSCHFQEAAKIDETFDAILSPERSTCSKLTLDTFCLLNLSPMCTLSIPTYSESRSIITSLSSSEEKSVFRDVFYRAFSYLWIKSNPALKGESYQMEVTKPSAMPLGTIGTEAQEDNEDQQTDKEKFSVKKALLKCKTTALDLLKKKSDSVESVLDTKNEDGSKKKIPHQSSVGSGPGSPHHSSAFQESREEPEPEILPETKRRRSLLSRQSSVLSQKEVQMPMPISRRISISTANSNNPAPAPTPARLVDVEYERIAEASSLNNNSQSRSYDRLSTVWIKQCVGDVIPSNAVKARVEKICDSVWDTVVGIDEGQHINLSDYFQPDFQTRLKGLSTTPRLNMKEITLKALRYSCKLALDLIFTSPSKLITIDSETEEELFRQLSRFERDHAFCLPSQLAQYISSDQGVATVITILQTEDPDRHILRILSYERSGVPFRIGQLDRFTVEGVWGNLSLELLYLTSDDDERYSIQNDRVLLRNLVSQCAKPPIGYPVYEATFRVNLQDFRATQIQ